MTDRFVYILHAESTGISTSMMPVLRHLNIRMIKRGAPCCNL